MSGPWLWALSNNTWSYHNTPSVGSKWNINQDFLARKNHVPQYSRFLVVFLHLLHSWLYHSLFGRGYTSSAPLLPLYICFISFSCPAKSRKIVTFAWNGGPTPYITQDHPNRLHPPPPPSILLTFSPPNGQKPMSQCPPEIMAVRTTIWRTRKKNQRARNKIKIRKRVKCHKSSPQYQQSDPWLLVHQRHVMDGSPLFSVTQNFLIRELYWLHFQSHFTFYHLARRGHVDIKLMHKNFHSNASPSMSKTEHS